MPTRSIQIRTKNGAFYAQGRRLACASLLYEFPESDPKVQCQNDVKHRVRLWSTIAKSVLIVSLQIERSLQILLDNFEQPESIGYGRVFQTAVYDIRQACHKQLINLWKHFTHRNEYKKRLKRPMNIYCKAGSEKLIQ